MEDLWGMLVPDADSSEVEPQPVSYVRIPEFFTQRAETTFWDTSDEIKKNRFKMNHTQGLVAQVEWIPTDESRAMGLTGMMGSGSDTVVMRLSQALILDEETSPGLLPSVAFKFLRDGNVSRNIFGMPSFTPTDSWNWF